MADDWRVTVELEDGSGEGFGARLSEHELEDEAEERLGDTVAVSADGPRVFLYADTREAAESARDVVASIVDAEGAKATYTLDRWHPLADQWKPADEPLPETPEEKEAELDELEAQEEAETKEAGYAVWEVRLDLPSHGEAVELAERLGTEGPPGTKVQVQPGGEMVWEAAPRRSRIFYFIPNL